MDPVNVLSFSVYLVCLLTLVKPCGHAAELHYHDIPEHYVIGPMPQHISANHGVLYSTLCSSFSYTSSHRKCISVHSTRVPLFLHLGSILLLACGDVHPCPGPNYKYPCGVCHKPVKVNQKGILCDTCNLWHHIKCINMPTTEYFRLADNEEEPWECPDCSFPYKFTDSFFNITTSDSLENESILSEDTIPDRDIFQDFLTCGENTPENSLYHISTSTVFNTNSVNSLLYWKTNLSTVFLLRKAN